MPSEEKRRIVNTSGKGPAQEEERRPLLPPEAATTPQPPGMPHAQSGLAGHADDSRLLYVNRDGTQIVAKDSSEAHFVLNPDEPGPFAELLRRHHGQGGQAEQQPAEPAEPTPEPKE